jgi:hypothetical protein
MNKSIASIFVLFMLPAFLIAQQIEDTTYSPPIQHPVYEKGNGPIVLIDEAHYNYHTRDGRFKPFASLLERDGYIVNSSGNTFTTEQLQKGRILVISNALSKSSDEDWANPSSSAFTKEEIKAVKSWVIKGGSLLLIADHMPFAGDAAEMAVAFGFGFNNGFALDSNMRGIIDFTYDNDMLKKCAITSGRNEEENVAHVVSFTGQAFSIPEKASSIMQFDNRFLVYSPDTAWRFNTQTPVAPAEGLSQGAYMKYGKGRVVVFGEAAMFTAQLAGPNQYRVGMNSPQAESNYRLVLNIIHWLDGLY